MDNLNVFGLRLRNLRKKNKLTLEEVGKAVNVTKVSICGYEKGTRYPSLDILINLANFYKCDLDYLFGRKSKKEQDNFLSEEEKELIKYIRNNRKIYKMLIENPKQTIELIRRKI